MIENFVRSHHGGEVIAAHHKLRAYSYTADLDRYCLPYVKGALGISTQSFDGLPQ
jgi:hypothetical protein